jgi:hypothetical protein
MLLDKVASKFYSIIVPCLALLLAPLDLRTLHTCPSRVVERSAASWRDVRVVFLAQDQVSLFLIRGKIVAFDALTKARMTHPFFF